MLFGRDLQHGRDGLHVGVDGVTDHLGDELVDQDDANVITSQEAPRRRKSLVNSEQALRNYRPYLIKISCNVSTLLLENVDKVMWSVFMTEKEMLVQNSENYNFKLSLFLAKFNLII